MRFPDLEPFIIDTVIPNPACRSPPRPRSSSSGWAGLSQQTCSDRLTNGNDEGHAEELAAERPLDLVEKVLVGGAEVPQDQPELGQRPVERVVVDLHHLVPLLKHKITLSYVMPYKIIPETSF